MLLIYICIRIEEVIIKFIGFYRDFDVLLINANQVLKSKYYLEQIDTREKKIFLH